MATKIMLIRSTDILSLQNTMDTTLLCQANQFDYMKIEFKIKALFHGGSLEPIGNNTRN